MADFIARIFKSWNVRDPERRWVNTYELSSDVAFSPTMGQNILTALTLAEKTIHLGHVQFLTGTISTWTPDSKPYNPDAFYTMELTGTGSRSANQEVLDSNVCYIVKKQASLGRSGRLFYRGCLMESDTDIGGDGRFKLNHESPLLQTGAAFAAYLTAMGSFLQEPVGLGDDLTLRLIGKYEGEGGVTITRSRRVEQLVVGGVTINRRNHRYFDRAAA